MKTLLTTCRRSVALRVASLLILLPSLVLLPSANIQANPENGVVVAGLAEIGEGLDGHLSIHQGSDRAIINWEAFSIAEGELTQFLQPGADSAILNRVIADNPSALNGALRANGNVFLINPAGIMVGPGGAIDVNGFVASTLDVPDASFMSGGDLIFSGSSENGVTNFGRISAVGGDVFLIGKSVTNAGSIAALEGTVGLAAGSEVLITAQPNAGGERVFVRPGPGAGAGNGVVNSGSIEGAAVELKAHGNMYAMAINNSGTVRATGSSSGGGGKVWLTAPGGHISNSGSIRASLPSGAGGSIFMNAGKGGVLTAGGEINADGTGGGSLGGKVVLLGEEISVPGGTSISANGDAGGGTVIIGGGANPQTDDEDEANSGGTVESSTINIAAGSSISASGANGPGGIVVIAGSDTSTVSVGGSVSATGGGGSDGGAIFLGGGDVTVTETSVIDASGGVNGGVITIQGETSATVNGGARAVGGSGDGGVITVTGKDGVTVGDTGVLDASGGTNGGVITVASEKGTATFNGTAMATGGTGNGGQITVTGDQGVSVGNNALLDASGGTNGGVIIIDGVNGVTDFNGTARANGGSGVGGRIDVTGDEANLNSTSALDASGASGGGAVNVGGGFQGADASIDNATNTTVGNGATINADALISGVGGQIVVWADNDTLFSGMLSARGIDQGGSAEVSGKRRLGYAGSSNLTATSGNNGTLLLDPTDVIIEWTGGAAVIGVVDSDALANDLDMGTSVNITTDPFAGAGLGNITVRSNVEWYQDSAAIVPGTLGLFAHNNILFADDVRSAGTGGINIVAGWDGVDTDVAAIMASMNDGNAGNDRAGLNGGSVFINGYTIAGAPTDGTANGVVTGEFNPRPREGIEVGSRYGNTQVAAHDVLLRGKDGSGDRFWAQLGFRDNGNEYELGFTSNGERNEWWGNAAGNAQGKDYITLLGGTQVATGAFLGAGHGATGDIVVQASGRVDVRAGDDTWSYAQIGHGGSGAQGLEQHRTTAIPSRTTRDGFVMDTGETNLMFFGTSWRTNYIPNGGTIALSNGDMIDSRVDADISIEAGEHFFAMASQNMEGTGGGGGFFDLTNENGASNRYVQIGHGGHDNYGSYHGNIDITTHGATVAGTGNNNFGLAGAGIQLRAGRGTYNSAQIGHGGFHEGNRGTIYDQTASGDITLNAISGAVRALGFSQMPREGNDNTGTLVGPTDVLLDTTSGNETLYSFLQIGHGGWHNSNSVAAVDGSFTGPVASINAGQPHQNMQGDIDIFAGGTVQVLDHMGYDAAGNWIADQGPGTDFQDRNNAINSIARNVGVEVRAGNNYFAYALVGHGGTRIRPDDNVLMPIGIEGDIDVTADVGSIMMVGGEEGRPERTWGYGRNFVQVGHGGWDVDARTDGIQGDINVSAGQGGAATEGSVIARTGRAIESFARIGHGGYASHFNLVGDGATAASSHIDVIARDHIEFTGRKAMPTDAATLSSQFYIRNSLNEEINRYIGAGGIGADTRPQIANRGTTYDIDRSFVQIGHGGYDWAADNGVNLSLNNTIDVTSGTAGDGNIRFTTGDGSQAFAMIGMGGREDAEDHDVVGGDITINAAGDVFFDARNGGIAETNQHGIGSDIDGRARNDWGRGHESFAMIGNGGYDIDGDFDGEIRVTTTNGGNLYMLGPNTNAQVFSVMNYVGSTVEGVTDSVGGIRQMTVGNAHAFTALQEATMKARTFQLFHGNNGGAASSGHVGNIIPNSFNIDTADGGGADIRDDGLGNLVVSGDPISGHAVGAVVGSIDYTTGKVTIFERIETGDGNFDRNVDYSYDNSGATGGTGTGSATQAIGDETTFESDAALRGNQAYLGHGGIVAGSVSIVIDGNDDGNGRQVIRDLFGNGVLYNEQNLRVGSISYDTGRVIIEGINTATADNSAVGSAGENILNVGTVLSLRAPLNDRINPDEVIANYEYQVGNSDRSWVQLGNGGYASQVGGRNSLGSTGEIVVDVAGDVRFHGGAFERNAAQLGHGGFDNQSRHGFQGDPGAAVAGGAWGSAPLTDTDALDLVGNRDGNITVTAGGIVEFLSGRTLRYFDNEQYSQLGHGGLNADGHHQGNIRVTAGSGNLSSAPGLIGDSAQTASVVFTGGVGRDSYTQLGHGGFGARSSRANNDPGARGLTGTIDVTATDDILFTSGTLLSNRYDFDDGRIYSQLGHGGYDADVRHNGGTNLRGTGLGHNGDITVMSGGSIAFQAGDQNVNAPGSTSGLGAGFGIIHYTQLGHGGYSTQGDHSGNITVVAADDISFMGGSNTLDDSTDKRNFAILGHGGDESEGYNGARDAGNDPTETISVTATSGDISFVAGSGRRNWVQLGNGGFSNNGDHVADIDVSAGGNIHFIGGQSPDVYQIRGESGLSIDRATFGFAAGGAQGWTPLRRKDVRIEDTGNTTPGRPFTITVDGFSYVANGLTLIEADGDAAFTTANIIAAADGNGFVTGQKVGEIDLRNGEVRFIVDIDPNDTNTYTTNYGTSGSGNPDSNTSLDSTATNPALVQAIQGPGTGNTMQILAYSNNTLGGITDVDSALDAPFGSNVGIAAGSFKMTLPDGTIIGENGTNLEVQTVGGTSALTMGQTVGTIDIATGQVTMTTAVNPLGKAGVKVDYDLDRPVGADFAYAKLGNGGYTADHIETNTDKSNVGDINVVAGGDIRFHAGDGDDAFTQLGHGGYDTKGAHSGNIDVTAGGGLEFLGGIGRDRTDGRAFAHLGHGGYDSDGNHFGNITVTTGIGWESAAPGLANIPTADNGTKLGVLFRAGDRSDNQVQLGHGGRSARSGTSTVGFGLNGDIKVVSEGEINFIAGALTQDRYETDDARLYAHLGHGGYDADPESDGGGAYTGVGHNGDIIVVSTDNSITFAGSDTTRTNHPSSGGGTAFAPEGGGRFHYALLGHGGYAANGDHNGNIFVSAGIAYDSTTDRPVFNAGTNSYTVNNALADVNVLAGRSTDDNSGDKNNFATIGNGGRSASGHMGLATDTTTVMAGQDVNVRAGAGDYSYASIGNGGAAGRGDHKGNVQVYAERDVNVVGTDYVGGDIFQSIQGTGTANASWDRAGNLGISTQTPTDGAGMVRLDSAIRYADSSDTMVIEVRDDAGNLIGTITDSMGDNRLYFTSDVTADFGAGTVTIASTTPVGTITANSRVRFDVDVNPGADTGPANLTAAYRHNDVDQAYAMIGHGGYDTDNNNDDVTAVRPGHVGNISVTARTGDINVLAGGDAAAFAQIGNGGWETVGSHQGDIHVRAGGDMVATGSSNGNGWQAYAQVGHGGNMSNIGDDASPVGNYSGLIKVSAGTGELATSVDLGTTGKFNDVGDFDGDGTADTILFATTAGDGSITLTGGVTTQGYVQIGHGGHDADGDHDGIISVSAHRDITVAGGPSGNETSAQIGHGGTRSNGNLSGNISILSNIGKLTVDAGGGTERYALVGHGDDRTADANNSTGSRTGDIFVLVNNWETLPSGNNFAGIGHRSRDANNGMTPGTMDLNLFSTGTQTIGANSEAFLETMLNSGINVTLAAQNLILSSGAEIDYNSAAEFNILTTQNMTFLDRVQNAGVGDINLVAGWDMLTGVTPGTDPMAQPSFLPSGAINHIACAPNLTFNFAAIKDNGAIVAAGAYGNNNGSVFIGDGTQTVHAVVGSSAGHTYVLGHEVQVVGADTNDDRAQIGFDGTGTGDIMVHAKDGGVALDAGEAVRSHAKIGHGSTRSVQTAGSGMITVDTTGSVALNGSTDSNASGQDSFAQIGHGAILNNQAQGAAGDTIEVTAGTGVTLTAGAGDNTYALIGNGGLASNTATQQADITVTTTTGNITLTGGTSTNVAGDDSFAQIGNTGVGGTANTQGNITVTASAGDVAINGGAGNAGSTPNFAQIGHGGAEAKGSHGVADDVTTVSAQNVALTGGSTAGVEGYAQIGNAGFEADGPTAGSILVAATEMVTVQGGTRTDAYAQIGHGGSFASGDHGVAGNTLVVTGTTGVNVLGGGTRGSAQIGNGGRQVVGTHTMDVTVNSGTGADIVLTGGTGSDSYALVGHGGSGLDAANRGSVTTSSSIDVNSGRDVVLTADSSEGFAQIGHGGAIMTGAITNAQINVDAVRHIDLNADPTGGNSSPAQIGHGGYNSTPLSATTSNILINTAAGMGSGDITLDGGVGGTNSYAQIGHGGARPDSDRVFVAHSGDITIGAAANVTLTSGDNTDAYTQIGHGGEGGGNAVPAALGDYSGAIMITTAGTAKLQAGSGGDTYSQIGHGGDNAEANTDGDITVTAASIDIDGGTGNVDAYAQIGNGGHGNDGNHSGDIALMATTGTFTVNGGSADNAYAQVGHGGNDDAGDDAGDDTAVNTLSGDIFINVDPTTFVPTLTSGDLTVGGGSGNDAYAQVGHGGDGGRSNTDGNIVTFSGGTVAVQGGSNNDAYSQIGHGGHNNDGIHGAASDVIVVAALNGVDLDGGTGGSRAYAQIGQGGADSDGALSGTVLVNFDPINGVAAGAGAVTLDSGAATDAYTQIGNGGASADGAKIGDTIVFGDSVRVRANAGAGAYSQIGAGSGIFGDASDFGSGDITSNTSVTATTGGVAVDASAGGNQAYAQIGAGGLLADDNAGGNTLNGTTTVSAAGALTLDGGAQSNNAARIGLGGSGMGNGGTVTNLVNADVTVTAASVTMNSGDGAAAYTQIGAGGGETGGPNPSAGSVTGDVLVTTTSGGVTLNGGGGTSTNSQIGLGGNSSVGAMSGTVTVNSATTVDLTGGGGDKSGAQIGSGGDGSSGSKTGAISVTGDSVSLAGGTNATSAAQIGHGGTNGSGQIDGGVSVIADGAAGSGDIALASNAGSAQIGSGGAGYNGGVSNGNIVATTENGDVLVNAAAGGVDAIAQIGHGGVGMTGGAITGTITVDTTTNNNITDDEVILTGGANAGTAARIGHGGAGSGNEVSGNVTVTSDTNVTLASGTGDRAGTQIGHGGDSSSGVRSGTIDVTSSGGTVALTGGGVDAGSQIGHGGDGSSGSKTGAISVTGDSVSLAGGTNATSAAQIGHGGTNGSGQIDGGVSVIADGAAGSGDIALASNAGSAQIGSGGAGYNGGVSNGNIVATTENGDVLVSAAAGGVDAIAQIGHGGVGMTGGAITGTITVDTTTNNNITDDEVILTGGANAGTAARIGHGGAGSGNEVSGNVTVTSDTNVTLASGTGDRAGTQIGHGGDSSSGVRSGTIDVTGGGTVALTGGGVDAGSQIGHGGRNALGDSGGDVTVTSTSADTANDDVTVAGGTGTGAYAQIGNGGTNSGALGAITGNVTVTAPGAVAVTGGDGVGANAQIGLGGESSSGTLGSASQTTSVTAGGDVTLTAGPNASTFAQIGNGGQNASGATKEGDTTVTSGGDVNLTGGGGVFSYAQIGLGGATANGDRSGDVTVNAGDDVNLMRGAGPSAYAKIGHGDQLFSQPSGFGGTGTSNGDITVTAVDSLGLTGGMIGHVDPVLGGATAGTGNTSIAVSRFDDPAITNGTHGPDTGVGESNRDPGTGLQSPNVDDGGNLVADADSVFSSNGDLRFYIPTRSDNQIVGATLNGTVFPGAPTDPSNQLANEFTVVRYPPGSTTPVHEDQHDNTLGGTVAGYDAASGFSFYYDALVGQPQGYVPPVPGGGGGSGGGGVPILLPLGAGGGSGPATLPTVVPLDPFFVFINGVPFFGSNRLFDGSPRTRVGFFLFGELEDRYDNEEPRDNADGEDENDEDGKRKRSSYEIDYRDDNRAGVSSFDVFGGDDTSEDASYFNP